jgi:hypothetical protein
MYVHDLILCRATFIQHTCNSSRVTLKNTVNFNSQPSAMFVLLVLPKHGLIRSCSSFQDISIYKIAWSHVGRWKFCIHHRSLNVTNPGILETTKLKVITFMSPSIPYPPYWISWNLTIWFNSCYGRDRHTDSHTDTQTGRWFHKLTFFL